MRTAEIAAWLKRTIEPMPDRSYGDRYRASVFLKDGMYLPCVVFQSQDLQVELALRRFDQLRNQSAQYRAVVESFVASGSRLANYDIKTVEPSPFAWPLATLHTIDGETTMSWTAFVVEMRDGTLHTYGTSFSVEFFDLPHGYTYADIAQIHSGMLRCVLAAFAARDRFRAACCFCACRSRRRCWRSCFSW
jgi:hypothetical protein